MVLIGGKGLNGQRWAPKRPQHLPLWGVVGTGVGEAEWKGLVLKASAGFALGCLSLWLC